MDARHRLAEGSQKRVVSIEQHSKSGCRAAIWCDRQTEAMLHFFNQEDLFTQLMSQTWHDMLDMGLPIACIASEYDRLMATNCTQFACLAGWD